MLADVQGSGDPLLLVPGGLTGWASWEPFVDTFATDHQVIRVQLINVRYGLEGRPLPDDYSISTEVEALEASVESLGDERPPDVIAWSYGALTALSYAIHHPERVRSLTLIEPPAYWILKRRRALSQDLTDDRDFQRSLAVDSITEEQLVAFAHYAGLVPEDVDPRTLPPWSGWMKHRQSLRFGDVPFRHDDDIGLVRSFDKPVLLIKGDGSTPFYHDIIDILADELPDARVVTLEGGHAAHIVSRDAFLSAFHDFQQQTR